ncbi:hypothetical protein Pfo_015607 [Paulownia fortunei]|nr:hypothetical protein Pfo_015607 [Paulownia fortunei]
MQDYLHLQESVGPVHFSLKALPEEGDYGLLMDEAFDMFSRGVHYHGPFWDHILGYWECKKLKGSKRVLFLRYEDLKEDINSCVRKIAEFVGFPFSAEEEKQGAVEEIAKLCSFNNLKNLEVNKNGKKYPWFKNDAFFRKGEVGDWTNYLTPSMAERAAKIMQEKFGGSGLTF